MQWVRLYLGVTIEKYHLIVFGLAACECIALVLHWAYLQKTELHFVALYLLVNEVVVSGTHLNITVSSVLRVLWRPRFEDTSQAKYSRIVRVSFAL